MSQSAWDQATASTSSARTPTALPRVCPTDRDLVSRRRELNKLVDGLTPKIGDLRISNGRSANHDAYDRLQRRQGRSSTIGRLSEAPPPFIAAQTPCHPVWL